jgi:hypothetical protein
MRLQELFLIETTEEDRAIVSVASALNSYIQKYEGEDAGGDFYDGDEDPDDTIHDEMKVIGSIKELVGDSPIPEFNGINIILQSDYGIRLRKKKEAEARGVTPPSTSIMGMWYPASRAIILNKDYIGYNTLRTVISHELRHALDDIKSDFEANKSGGRYSIPRKKSHRRETNDPYFGNLRYLAEPAEINARFLQVLDRMVKVIKNFATKLTPEQSRAKIMNQFHEIMKDERISELFPEKEKSRDYKRLMKRGVDFIDKEIAYVRSQSK